MYVLVHREGVCMADDIETPHPRRFDVPDHATVEEVLRRVRDAGYLASIAGGRATWVVEGERPLAVVTQEYRDPWPLILGSTRLVEVAGHLPKPHLFFRYLAQRPPEDVFRELGGDPVHLGKDAFKASKEISWPAALRDFLTERRR